MGWAAIDTLVKLTKENVDMLLTPVENDWEATAVDTSVANTI